MRDNLEMKEGGGDEEWSSEGSLKDKLLKSKEKYGGKARMPFMKLQNILSTIFENHKVSTCTRVLPVQESKNKKKKKKATNEQK